MRRCFFSFCDCLSKAGYLLAETAALLGIRCRTHHWRRLEKCSAWQYWAAYFQGGSKVILTRPCRQQTHANDRWVQVKPQSCGGVRSATATQRRKESSASSCTICTMMQSCCAVEDDGRRIVFAAAPPVAAASRFSWTQPSWAHWAAFNLSRAFFGAVESAPQELDWWRQHMAVERSGEIQCAEVRRPRGFPPKIGRDLPKIGRSRKRRESARNAASSLFWAARPPLSYFPLNA
jgi:hypothetical protein